MPPRRHRLPETVKPFWDGVSLPPPQSGIPSPAVSPSGKSARVPPPDPQSPEFHGSRRFPAGFPLRPDRQDTGIRDAPPLSSNERSGSFCVPSLPIPPRPGRRGRPRPARRTEQTFRTIPPLRPDSPPHPAEDTIAEEDFPLAGTPGCSPGKTLAAPNRLQKRKKNQNAPVLPDSPAETLCSASFPPYTPASLRLPVAFRKQYTRLREQNQEQKKARPDRTGSGDRLTFLRRFLCLCKRWNRLFSLLWRESDWSCSG